jgi:hypothetical protein
VSRSLRRACELQDLVSLISKLYLVTTNGESFNCRPGIFLPHGSAITLKFAIHEVKPAYSVKMESGAAPPSCTTCHKVRIISYHLSYLSRRAHYRLSAHELDMPKTLLFQSILRCETVTLTTKTFSFKPTSRNPSSAVRNVKPPPTVPANAKKQIGRTTNASAAPKPPRNKTQPLPLVHHPERTTRASTPRTNSSAFPTTTTYTSSPRKKHSYS